LDQYQIDINDPINGTALIGGTGAPQTTTPRHHHGSDLHSDRAIRRINARIVNAQLHVNDWGQAQATVIAELQ
jgi:hypothetical protein